MQGVLSEKVLHLGRIEHTVKMYDFEDRTPGAKVIEAVVAAPSIMIQEAVLPTIEEVIDIGEKGLDIIANSSSVSGSEVPVVRKRVKMRFPAPTVINSITILRPGDAALD